MADSSPEAHGIGPDHQIQTSTSKGKPAGIHASSRTTLTRHAQRNYLPSNELFNAQRKLCATCPTTLRTGPTVEGFWQNWVCRSWQWAMPSRLSCLTKPRKHEDTILSDQVNLQYGLQLWLRMLKEDTNSPFRDCARMGDLWTIKVQNALTNVEQHVLRLLDNSLILSNCFYHTLQLSKHAVKRFPGDTFRQQAPEQSTEMCERIQRRMTLEKVIRGSERETKERLRDAKHSGNVMQIPYPWIKKAMLERSKAIMHEASGAMR